MAGKRLVIFLILLGLLLEGIPILANDNPWSIEINIPEYRLFLYHNGELYKIFKVAVGKFDSQSPIGEFRIINKVTNPTWYPENHAAIPPGPKNPLGKYWMGLNSKGYGIHGNSAPWSIGAPASKGCFRMDNDAIKELFSLVPVGTTVKVNYEIVKCKIDDDNRAWLEIYPDIYRRSNLEIKVQQVLTGLDWHYQPHQKALSLLISGKKPLRVTVPRKIIIEDDYSEPGLDGFYWNGRVYLSRCFLEKNFPSLINDDQLFPGFTSWDINGIPGSLRKALIWNETLNTIWIKTLKVFINDEKIDEAGRFGSQGEILINYSKISNWFADKRLLREEKLAIALDELKLFGDYIDGDLWITPDLLKMKFNEFSYYFDENTLTLFTYYHNKRIRDI